MNQPVVDTTNPAFTPEELTRLAAYKAAIHVGLYTDSDDVDKEHHRFTAVELMRLTIYKQAFQSGFYTDS